MSIKPQVFVKKQTQTTPTERERCKIQHARDGAQKTTRDSDPSVHSALHKRQQLDFAREDPGALFEVQLPML